MNRLILSTIALVLTITALFLTVSFLFSSQSRNNAFSSFISFFCLTSLCLTAACYNAYAAHEVDERFSGYDHTYCNITSYTESQVHSFCKADITVEYRNPYEDGPDSCTVSMVSGHWMDVKTSNHHDGHICGDSYQEGSHQPCIVSPDQCDTAILGWSTDPVCDTTAVDGTTRDCDIIPMTALLSGVFVMICCLLSVCTMMLSNGCLLDECWSSGVRWMTSYATILLYMIIWGLTCYCTYAISQTTCTALMGWGVALVVHGAFCMGVLLPYLLFRSFKMEFSVLIIFLFGVVLDILLSWYAYQDIWERPEGECLDGWKYDYVHFLWVLTLVSNIIFGIPPIFLLIWECILQITESYSVRIIRRRKETFTRRFEDHLNGQKKSVMGILRHVSLSRKADANVWDLISKYSYEMETLVSKESNLEIDSISDRLFVNRRHGIGLTKDHLLEMEFESQYRSLLELNAFYDRLVLRVGKWTTLHVGINVKPHVEELEIQD